MKGKGSAGMSVFIYDVSKVSVDSADSFVILAIQSPPITLQFRFFNREELHKFQQAISDAKNQAITIGVPAHKETPTFHTFSHGHVVVDVGDLKTFSVKTYPDQSPPYVELRFYITGLDISFFFGSMKALEEIERGLAKAKEDLEDVLRMLEIALHELSQEKEDWDVQGENWG